MPTTYVIGWLQDPQAHHLRQQALLPAERALAAASRSNDQWLYLLELRDIIQHPWKYPDHEEYADVREHVHQLHDTLTDEQLHGVDWHLVAQSLVA